MIKKSIIALLAFGSLKLNADIVFLNNGDEINAPITYVKDGKVAVTKDGKKKEYEIKDVMKLQFIKEYRSAKDPFSEPEIKNLIANPPSPDAYPEAGYVNIYKEIAINLNKDKSYSESVRVIRYVVREKGIDKAGNSKIYYVPEFQRAKIDYAFNILDNKIDYLNDVSIQDGNEYSFYPEYNKLRSLKFSVPNIKTGSIVEFKYTVDSSSNPFMPFYETAFFRDFEPSLKTSLIASVPTNLKINYSEFGLPEGYSPTITKTGDATVYTWETTNQSAYHNEPMMPDYSLFASQVSLSIDDSWANVAKTFGDEISKKSAANDDIKSAVAEATKNSKTDEEKAAAIFNWVAKNITLSPVSAQDYSYLPKDAAKIFSSKTGNYLDKPFLFYVMLKTAGLNPSFSYSTDKNDTLFHPELTNVSQFFGAQVNLSVNGKDLTMVPLDEKQKYDQLPPEYQGGWAAGVLGTKSGQIFQNAYSSFDEEKTEKNEKIEMDKNGGIKASLEITPKGNDERNWRRLKDYKEKELKNFFEEYVHNISPEARLVSYKIENLGDITKPLSVTVDYSADSYAVNLSGKYLLFKFPAIKYSAGAVGLSKRELPVFFRNKKMSLRTSVIKLPGGYEVYHAPEKLELSFMDDAYSANYESGKDSIVLNETFSSGETVILPENYQDYKNFVEKIADFTDEWVVIKKL